MIILQYVAYVVLNQMQPFLADNFVTESVLGMKMPPTESNSWQHTKKPVVVSGNLLENDGDSELCCLYSFKVGKSTSHYQNEI